MVQLMLQISCGVPHQVLPELRAPQVGRGLAASTGCRHGCKPVTFCGLKAKDLTDGLGC